MSTPTKPIYRKHGFTLALLVVLVLASIFPEPGVEGGALRSEWTTKLGVWIIFFLQGLSLPCKELAKGYRPVRLQAFVLAWNYLLFPFVTIACLFAVGHWLSPDMVLGFGLLSILPTTIASAVALTSLAGGRAASAVCATVLSNLLAVLVVPLWVAFYLQAEGRIGLPLLPLWGQLALLIVLPLIVGQALRAAAPTIAAVAAKWTKPISSGIILFIVYVAFAGSVAQGQFEAFSGAAIIHLLFGALSLLILTSGLVWLTSAALRLSPGDRLAAYFCASQKSIATGIPLATAIFAAVPDSMAIHTGALLLPLIVFHPLQLVYAVIWVGLSRAD